MKAFCKHDKAAGWATLKACLRYVQSQNDIEEGATGPSKKKHKNNKGKPKPVYAAVEEMSDDDWEEAE